MIKMLTDHEAGEARPKNGNRWGSLSALVLWRRAASNSTTRPASRLG